MIILGLMRLLKALLSVLLVFELPSFPSQIPQAVATMTRYLGEGVAILRVLVGPEAVVMMQVCFTIIVSVELMLKTWQFVWWVLGKIPMLNIKG